MVLTKKNYQIVADEIGRMIAEGMLRPGDKIATIDRLAEQFGVGKSTVREALSQLKARNLIEARQGEGTYVKKNAAAAMASLPPLLSSPPDELLHLLQVRKVIESGCAELAALHRDEHDLTLLEQILEKMSLSVNSEESSRLVDIQFHTAIAAATKNPYLTAMMNSLSEAMNASIRDSRNLWLYARGDSSVRLWQEHQEIYQAIRDRDPEAARSRLLRHLEQVEQALHEKR